jgi:polar amino acid transport system substrate-binding protein
MRTPGSGGSRGRRRVAGIAIGVAGMVVAAAAILITLDSNASLRKIRAAGVIRVGYAIEAPYAYLGDDGEPTGESIEVARTIVARLGVARINWVHVDFAMLITGLEEARFDVIAAGLFITPERSRRVAFSDPTFSVGPALLVASGNPKNLHTYREAGGRTDVRIAVIAGAVEESLLRGFGMNEPRLVIVPDALTGRTAVATGVADGLALSAPTVRWMAARAPAGTVEPAAPFVQDGGTAGIGWGIGAFAFRTGDRWLREAWNEAMQGLIGGPEHLRLIEGFGFPIRSPRGRTPGR